MHTAQHLLITHVITDEFIRIIIVFGHLFDTLFQGGQVSGGVKVSAVALDQQQGREHDGQDEHGVVRVRLESDGTPDTVISGTPVALFSMAEPDDADWGLPESKVQINGDATLARDLERIFRNLDPDWEGPLAGLLGDVAGHQAAQGIRQGVKTARETARNAGKVLSDIMRDRRS